MHGLLKWRIHVKKLNEEKISKLSTSSKVKLSAVNPLLTPTSSAEAAQESETEVTVGEFQLRAVINETYWLVFPPRLLL